MFFNSLMTPVKLYQYRCYVNTHTRERALERPWDSGWRTVVPSECCGLLLCIQWHGIGHESKPRLTVEPI